MPYKTALRDFVACLSLANLIMMKIWLLLLPFNAGKSFWLAHSPANSYLAAMFNTMLLALCLWGMSVIAGHLKISAMVIWPTLYFGAFCFALNGIRSNFNWGVHNLYRALGNGGVLVAAVVVISGLAGILFWTIRNRRLVARQHWGMAFAIAPFLLVTFGQSVFALWRVEPESAFVPPEHQRSFVTSTNAPGIQVVWIIFDELDYGISFGRSEADQKK